MPEIESLRQVRLVEERLVVLDGSTKCLSRASCDRRPRESYELYVRRHAREHQLGEFEHLEDAERNLFLWCFYFADKWGIGNKAIGPDPFWEHHVFLSEWSFNPDDLEQGFLKDRRRYAPLPDFANMRPSKIEKRFKKIQKPRESMKSAVGRGYVTWRMVRAFYVENNPYFRVLILSSASRLARIQWFKPLKMLWAVNKNLIRLFGAWEFTCDNCGRRVALSKRLTPNVDNCPKCGARLGARVRVRQAGLVTKGSFGLDSIQLRWSVIPPDDFSGLAAENLLFGGVDTELQGQRFDLVMADDISTAKNCYSFDLRENVKNCFAEVTRQLGSGQLVLSCTPQHLDDIGADIERRDGPYYDQFHILRRAASHLDESGATVYYWPEDALGNRKLDEQFLRDKLAMTSEREFFSQYMDECEDPSKSSFKSAWFEFASDKEVPPPVMWGVGCDITPEQQARIDAEGIVVDRFLYIDPAGHEKQKKRNDDTALFGGAIYRGVVYVLYLRSFKGPDSKEKEEIYQAAAFLRPRIIRYFRANNEREDALQSSFANYAIMKSRELSEAAGHPVNLFLPMVFPPESTIVSKRSKIEKTEPLWRAGRVKLVRCAGITETERVKCRDQYVGLGITDHDDYPDAGSALQDDISIPTYSVVVAAEQKANFARTNERGNIEVPLGDLFKQMRPGSGGGRGGVRGSRWGTREPQQPAQRPGAREVVNSDIPETTWEGK